MYRGVVPFQSPVATFVRAVATVDPRFQFLMRHSGFDERSSLHGMFSITYLTQVLLTWLMAQGLHVSGSMFAPDDIMRAHLGEGVREAFARYYLRRPEAEIEKPGKLPFCYIHAIIAFYRLPLTDEIRDICRHERHMNTLRLEYGHLTRFRESLQEKPRQKRRAADEDEKEKCSICLKALRRTGLHQMTNCSHQFHRSCIREWLKNNKTCPLCRAPA